MSEMMTFPDTVEEFMESYKVVDSEQVYSNGIEFVPIFRMKQWFEHLPPAQPQRDIPKKPNETIESSWGISTRQAVCPNCDAYLGMVHFICESEKKVTYCESCGQAIDWTDWEDNDG